MKERMPRPNQHAAIYELLNETLREVYVGYTDQPLEAFAVRIRERRPEVLKHWLDEHRIVFRCVEPEVSAADAPSFVGRYAGAIAAKEMKVFWQDMLWLD